MIGTDARPPLLLVTDPAFAEGVILEVIDRVARAVPAGSFAVQLRDKSRDAAALLPFGLRLRAWTKERRVALVVNGDPPPTTTPTSSERGSSEPTPRWSAPSSRRRARARPGARSRFATRARSPAAPWPCTRSAASTRAVRDSAAMQARTAWP